ncbi:hypothetical protein IFM89_007945 [Coptis chinensis]|uniref:Uncharacterized protein n=1 Tax=Coptis chinensis TaxID=261450 RepID=A0A835ILX4_9MAGN|nr:hypothetical protein IFM89_007945 [Coptis chinensis]
MMTRMSILITIISLFFSITTTPTCLADIRYTNIRRFRPAVKPSSLVYIDVFGFTESGRLELNASHITFPTNAYPNNEFFNLSKLGFFLPPTRVSNGV